VHWARGVKKRFIREVGSGRGGRRSLRRGRIGTTGEE